MKREWKPGDVVGGQFGRLFIYRDHDSKEVRYIFDDGSGVRPVSELTFPVRPLAVIDPEDRSQIERLIRLFCHHTPRGDAEFVLRHGGVNSMQAALREFADPKPPKPEEPLGLGAVVEDTDGAIWTRVATHAAAPWYSAGVTGAATNSCSASWSRIDVARILSDGWTPDA